MNNKVVGVTGASGTIGRVVVNKLLDKGYKVKDIRIEVGDISQVIEFVKDCDFVIHLAVEMDTKKPYKVFKKTNIVGVKNILNSIESQRVVMVSSVVVLQYTGKTGNYYVDTKIEGIRLIRESNKKVVTVMPSIVVNKRIFEKNNIKKFDSKLLNWLYQNVGGGMPGGLMSLIGDKNRKINMVEVEDVAEGIILAMEKGRLGEEYVLGGENKKVSDYLNKVSVKMGTKYLNIRTPYWLIKIVNTIMGMQITEPVDMNFDSDKAIRDFGYKITWRI